VVNLVVAAAFVISAQAAQPVSATPSLRCFDVGPGIVLRKEQVADIKRVVRGATGRPLVSIELPDPSERPPTRVLQVVTLLRGNCENGEGQRLWIRKGSRGWQVVRNLGGEGWGTASAARTVE
jgi:hypothetical protein